MLDREKRPQFLFENFGSRGDVVPFIDIASELVRRRYRCTLLANEHFEAEARAAGISFSGTTGDRIHHLVMRPAVDYLYYTFDRVREYFERPSGFDSNTVVVNAEDWSSSEPLAEAHGLRTVRLVQFPVRIKSLLSPAWPLGARAEGPDGEHFLKVILPAMYRAAASNPGVLAKVNGIRARVGLTPVRSAMFERSHVVEQLALFPEWYAMRAKDWPEIECLGFPLASSNEPLPPRLLEFLARFPRPLVFTTGTGFGQPERFFEAAADCCTALGMPGVFLSPFYRPEPGKLGEHIIHFDHVELEGVLRHSRLIVHHGGMGTTARALQAGIPQVISPIGFDQPDNGHRVALLGAGLVVPRPWMSGESFAAAVRVLLSDPEVASRLPHYRAAIAPMRAIERCADALERVAFGTVNAALEHNACA
jgi:rhamnosyltransferase subunit B